MDFFKETTEERRESFFKNNICMNLGAVTPPQKKKTNLNGQYKFLMKSFLIKQNLVLLVP